jgi:hypothetical protein
MEISRAIIEVAILGFERQKQHEAIAELRAQLNGSAQANKGGRKAKIADTAARPRRKMSAAARKRIAAAQKKRRAEFHAKQKAKK